ncbi:PQQ-dependent sugar dehydrogenase [Nocardioides rubriscoriae]|uniref:PQQ-dependent sugar dehydrogenase n=1 Tax=Nocardioides rubriscoriae TaxID=642762 RepID=UPI0011DFCA5A|nr:PQQ-dependent sugar dehydrogenase [Nocardioides rubriscoriae]
MRRALVPAVVLALVAPLLTVPAAHAVIDVHSVPAPAERRADPALQVSTRVAGLNHPWDVKELPSGSLLITERDPARLTLSRPDGTQRAVRFPTARIWTSGETGLMGLALDPNFVDNRRFYTCSGWEKQGPGHDIRVNAWTLDKAERRATLVRALLTGLPTTSGRHGGCRLLAAADGSLLVGTGDAAVGTNPRNLRSLGGKTLQLDRFTGKPWRTNPFRRAKVKAKRYVTTYGHRNVQGLAQRADGTLWSVEHGTYRDDEVNLLVGGGDYGWNPVPGYNEQVPMTDQGLPGKQISARWRSGTPTVATSGATFVYGDRWGSLDGALFVATLAGERLLALTFGPRGFLQRVSTPPALDGTHGRLRTVTQLRNGNLLICTDADGGQGKVLLVKPT